MEDASLCPYRHHNGLLLECSYREVVCKRSFCPYFKTLEQARASYGKMMQDAVERVVKADAGGYPYIDCNIELYDYDKDIPLAKDGDKVKIIVIK